MNNNNMNNNFHYSSLIRTESPANGNVGFPFGLAEHRLSLSAKFNMRQKPNFGVSSGVSSGAANHGAQSGTNSRLNLASQFEKDAELDSASPSASPMVRGGAGRKAGVKPPSSLAFDGGKKTPRGGDR